MTTSWHCMMSCCRHADSSGSWSVLPAGLTCCRDTALSSTCYQYLYMYCDGKYDPWYSRKCYHMHKAVCTMLSLTVPPFWTTCTQHYQLVVHYTTTCSLTTLDTQHWEWTSWWRLTSFFQFGSAPLLDCWLSILQSTTTRTTSIVQLPILCE